MRSVNLPNTLSLFRIFLVPLVVVVLLIKYPLTGLAIFWVAAITDMLDGYLARKRQQVTTLGQLLDPLADKLLISSAFICLVQLRLAPAWMVVIIIGREFAVTSLRSIAASGGMTIASSDLGKLKLNAQVAAVSLLIITDWLGKYRMLGILSLWVVVVLALISMSEYFFKFWKQVRFKLE
jgi:CDP-diacylglycerol--glycerol-3-phosphate 3-phosphatidyltransferase